MEDFSSDFSPKEISSAFTAIELHRRAGRGGFSGGSSGVALAAAVGVAGSQSTDVVLHLPWNRCTKAVRPIAGDFLR